MTSQRQSQLIGPVPQDPFFKNQRRAAISQHSTQIGIDYIKVEKESVPPREWLLKLYFIPQSASQDKEVRPTLTEANIRFEGEQQPGHFRVIEIDNQPSTGPNNMVLIRVQCDDETARQSEHSKSTLSLVGVEHLDPFFAQVSFSWQVNEPSQFDPQVVSVVQAEPLSAPEIDYLAKDYSSFRQLMLNRLSVLMPQPSSMMIWQERNPSDLGIALVEIMAYAADYLSYYQDAVATEAYMSTARRRVSMRRHARLIDYTMHEGCNARVWVQIEVNADDLMLPAGSKLLSKVAGQTAPVLDLPTYQEAQIQGATVFETMHDIELKADYNKILFYTWGAREFYLPEGCTNAILAGNFGDLKAGQVLLFEEVVDPMTGSQADPAHRHAVRLSEVIVREDGLYSAQPITEIRWHNEDALPFRLYISNYRYTTNQEISVARGNIVLADHGRTITNEALTPPRPHLRHPNLTYRVPYTLAPSLSAAATLKQAPRQATPAIKLTPNEAAHPSEGSDWLPLHDLLDSDRFTRAFVVEIESDGRAYLRFGDGVRGKQPPAERTFTATYRVGNGLAGNIGRQAIAHLVADDKTSSDFVGRVINVTNLLAASGGMEPEALSEVRLYAPRAFRQQERCVTAEDYAAIAKRHPEVQKAAAILRWSGSWYTAVLIIERRNNKPLDAEFQESLLRFMEPYRVAGVDITIRVPRFVALDIALTVDVASTHFASSVKQALIETFSAVDLPNRGRGFFHPDNFTFGEPIYLSKIIAEAVKVPGVVWVQATRFQRWGASREDQLEAGIIRLNPLEIAQLNNNQPAGARNGRLIFEMKGGR